MFTHPFASTHHRFMPRGLTMALAVSLALGGLPMAQAGQPASAAPNHQQSQGQTAASEEVTAGEDNAETHSIIFVGGRKQSAAVPRMVCPGGCSRHASPQTSSQSKGNDRSLNPQPIPPGH